MTENPLDNIRKRQTVERPKFPNRLYEDAVLVPARSSLNSLLTDAVVRVHQARIVDLAELRTIEKSDAAEALAALANANPEDAAGQRPLEHVEQLLARAGGGRALLATAPEEVEIAAMRIVLRARLLEYVEAIFRLRSAAARLALGHLTTAITATSNGQMVQPSTLGHYLTALLSPLKRTSRRLTATMSRVNLSPLGAVSGMATAVPARRERQAELLGFGGIIEHTFDALASADVEHEIASTVSGTALELLRLVNDLAQWSRDDTGIIVPSAEFVHGGGAQPQRRDPLVLDHLRVQLTEQVASANTIAMHLQSRAMIAGPVTRQQVFKQVEAQLSAATLTCNLIGNVLKTLEVNRALTANRSHKGFATSSELADLLAIDCQLTRTEAYLLAERIATEATVLALGGMTLDTKLVDKLALEVIGREVGIEPETLGKCLSVKRFLERREAPGGPAPASVRDMIEREHLARREEETWLLDCKELFSTAERDLDEAIEVLTV